MEQRVAASCHKHRRTTLERVEKYIGHNQFKDVNLRSKLFPAAKEVDGLFHWAVPGGHAAWEAWPFSKVVKQDFQAAAAGQSFGPLWSTHWFRVEVRVPESWAGQELWLHWVSDAEALLWSVDGVPLQGFSPGGRHLSPLRGAAATGDAEADQSRTDYLVRRRWDGSAETLVFYVETACCVMLGGGVDDIISPPDEARTFTVEAAEVSTRDPTVFKLLVDLEVMHDLAKVLPQDDPRSHAALQAANHVVNAVVKGDRAEASEVADLFFAKRNGGLAHTLALIGNCHIDSAWLWRYSESKRKCARSWSSVLALMEEYPELRFACSQAQQLSWVKDHYPGLYQRIRTQVKAGTFVPVGGTWVEMDGLLPGGESFVRQFLYGQLFFREEFGMLCEEFWLPDTFGYSAQLPQICRHFGIGRFLTQKMSWSFLNKFPHHSFIWEGLDGSTVLAHFPPGDSYKLRLRPKEALHSQTNLQDKGRVSTSAFLYGHGDGGGGPTRTMLERGRRLRDVDGCPRMEHMTPGAFFQRLEAERHNLCRWVGELYLELHNGTYTSQAKTKRLNRTCEFALRDAELLLAVAAVIFRMEKEEVARHQAALVDAWKKVLLNQFHDVIPGTSIGAVYEDSDRLYREALSCARKVKDDCLSVLLKSARKEKEEKHLMALNTLPWEVTQVMLVDENFAEEMKIKQHAGSRQCYVVMSVDGIGWHKLTSYPKLPPVKVTMTNGMYRLENQYIRADVNIQGQVESLVLVDGSRDVFGRRKTRGARQGSSEGSARWSTQGRGNQLVLFDDLPLYWDAWDVMDYHLETGRVLNAGPGGSVEQSVQVVESGPLMATLRWSLKLGDASTLVQDIQLSAVSRYLTFKCRVDWHENRKCLKVAFDTSLMARVAAFDAQFGYVERPTHTNTSWDSARFEVCGHKWADISEHDLGLAVLNDCKYGWTARGSMLMLSLLRSPKAPDDHCDMGTHTFAYALMPHKGLGDKTAVQRRAYEFNKGLSVHPAAKDLYGNKWYSVIGDGAMIEAVKLAEDGSGDVVLRVYETLGSSTSVKLWTQGRPELVGAYLCNGLEEPLEALSILPQMNVGLELSPFQIATVRLSYKQDAPGS